MLIAVITRRLQKTLSQALSDTPVVFLQGARQVGKTTLVQTLGQMSPQSIDSTRRYITLDDATALAAATADPEGFIAGLTGPVTIDEVQRAPGLALAIKSAVDRDRSPGRFLLTGSAGVLVLPRLADSLAGRMEILTLWPLAESETASAEKARGQDEASTIIDRLFDSRFDFDDSSSPDWPGMIELIARGGYPEIRSRTSPQRRAAWFGSYLSTILQRDIRDLANIEGLTQMPRLLSLLANRSAGLMNFADVARTVSMQQTTLKRYVALLQGVFLLELVPAWFINTSKRLAKAPKVLLNDSGLLMHLIGADEQRLISDPALAGHVLESWVGMELKKQLGWSKVSATLHHFNVHQGDEVDFVLEDRSGRVVGIEVKSSASVDASAFRGLRGLAKLAGKRFVRGIVLYAGRSVVAFEPQLAAVPLGALLSDGE